MSASALYELLNSTIVATPEALNVEKKIDATKECGITGLRAASVTHVMDSNIVIATIVCR